MPVRIKRIVLYTRSLVDLDAREPGSSRSCAARDNDNDNEFIFQFVQVVYINTIYEYINQ